MYVRFAVNYPCDELNNNNKGINYNWKGTGMWMGQPVDSQVYVGSKLVTSIESPYAMHRAELFYYQLLDVDVLDAEYLICGSRKVYIGKCNDDCTGILKNTGDSDGIATITGIDDYHSTFEITPTNDYVGEYYYCFYVHFANISNILLE